MSYEENDVGGVWSVRIAKAMEMYSVIVGTIVFLTAFFEVGYYVVNGSYYLPHPNLKADFGTMMGQALLYWGLPFAVALSPACVASTVRKEESLDTAFIYAIFGTLAVGVGLTIVFGIGLFILNFPLSLIVLVIHLVLGAFADSVAYGVIVTIVFVIIGVGIFSSTAGPAVYRVIIIIFKGDD